MTLVINNDKLLALDFEQKVRFSIYCYIIVTFHAHNIFDLCRQKSDPGDCWNLYVRSRFYREKKIVFPVTKLVWRYKFLYVRTWGINISNCLIKPGWSRWSETVELDEYNLLLISHVDMVLFAGLHQRMPLACFYQLQSAFRNVVHLWHQNCKIETMQTSSRPGDSQHIFSIHIY